MNRDEMFDRTKKFAIRIVKLASSLADKKVGDVLGRQVLRSGTSIGANYREAQRASSNKQFICMMEIVQREAHETSYWLELISESSLLPADRLTDLLDECVQLLKIVTATIRTSKRRRDE